MANQTLSSTKKGQRMGVLELSARNSKSFVESPPGKIWKFINPRNRIASESSETLADTHEGPTNWAMMEPHRCDASQHLLVQRHQANSRLSTVSGIFSCAKIERLHHLAHAKQSDSQSRRVVADRRIDVPMQVHGIGESKRTLDRGTDSQQEPVSPIVATILEMDPR